MYVTSICISNTLQAVKRVGILFYFNTIKTAYYLNLAFHTKLLSIFFLQIASHKKLCFLEVKFHLFLYTVILYPDRRDRKITSLTTDPAEITLDAFPVEKSIRIHKSLRNQTKWFTEVQQPLLNTQFKIASLLSINTSDRIQ